MPKRKLIIHADSHLDHDLTPDHVEWICQHFADRAAFFIETVELPSELDSLPCALYGPAMGDAAIPESEVTYAARGDRKGKSRLVDKPARPTRMVTVIAGPHDGEPCVLYTAFGGPSTPKEPFDCQEGEERTKSEAFWAEHALAKPAK